jgi:3-deoxy-D-manno-octulosonate 8-phosphate phosphatase (KDO 8-P phosphatase)
VANFSRISPALKRRAKQIELVLMDVDGTMTDGGVTLLSQPDGTALEIKTFDAHDGQGLTLAHTAGLRTGCITGRESAGSLAPRPGNEDGIYLHEAAIENAGL